MKRLALVFICVLFSAVISGCGSLPTSRSTSALGSNLQAATSTPALANTCTVILPKNLSMVSPYTGECLDRLAHGYGKVTVEKTYPKTGEKFIITYDGMFLSGQLTGKGKETEKFGKHRFEGTFNEWKRWTGTVYFAKTSRQAASQTSLRKGNITFLPVDPTQDPLYYSKPSNTSKAKRPVIQDVKVVRSLGFEGKDVLLAPRGDTSTTASTGCLVLYLHPNSLAYSLGIAEEGFVVFKYGHRILESCDDIDEITKSWNDDGSSGELQVANRDGRIGSGIVTASQFKRAQQNLNSANRNSASSSQASNSSRCEVIFPDQATLLSPYEGECRNGLAHGYGKVSIKRKLNTGVFDLSMEGVFQHGILTGLGKERGTGEQYSYEGTFNKWQRWNGVLRTGSGYRGTEEQWNYTNGFGARASIGTTVNVTKDPLYYARASNSDEEITAISEQQRLSERPQEEKTGYNSKERTGVFAIPIFGAFLSGIADGLPAAGNRVGEALKDVPKDTLSRKTDEWIARQEQRQRDREERKKQEEIAQQEQARVAVLAKQEQERRAALELAEAERQNKFAAQEEERKRQEQANIEASKKEQENREAQARSTVNAKDTSGGPVNPSPGANTQSPQVASQQPANGQSGGPASPSSSVATAPPVQNSPVTQQGAIATNRQPAVNAQPQQSTPPTYQNVLTPQEIEWNNSLPHMYRATTQFSPAQIAEIKKDGRWGPWVNQTKKEVTQLPASQQQTVRSTVQTGLTENDLRWANVLQPSVKTRVLAMPPSQVEKLRAAGQWNQVKQNLTNISAELVNNQYQSEVAAEEERIWSDAWNKFQTTIEVGSLALGVGELAIASRSIYVARRAALERQAAKNVGAAAARGVDSASTGGITKPTLHHICTDKNRLSTVCGGPWTPRFEAIFEKAGMTLEDGLNKVYILNHRGPHPEAYHQAVYDRLVSATNGLSGYAYKNAIESELGVIGREASTPGTLLNRLLTRQ